MDIMTELKTADVLKIHRLSTQGVRAETLAKMFDVSLPCIYNILKDNILKIGV